MPVVVSCLDALPEGGDLITKSEIGQYRQLIEPHMHVLSHRVSLLMQTEVINSTWL
jgi:hypothetical protein